MDGLGRSEVSSPSGLRVSRLANRSSADPIKQRPRVDCGQKQALGEGLGSKGIDSLKPVTEATSLCHGAGRYSPLMESQDIRDDDQRAGDIIGRMRGLLKKRSEID